MPFGYTGQILRIDLSKNKISIDEPLELFYRRYFGGRGFIAYFLLKELEPRVDPLSPMNKLIFACGPVTGAAISGSGRNSVGAKSPLTGAYGESEVGGFWGAELKRAGFDAIIIEDKAKSPVYLWICDGKVEIKDADHLWGMETKEVQNTICDELGEKSLRFAQIGLGGENLVRYASIINDMNHAAGRCGIGAVMGSKNLKAVVVKGKRAIKVANSDRLGQLQRWLIENMEKEVRGLHTYGTGYKMDAGLEIGNIPVHNFRDSEFPNIDAISAQTIKETVRVGMGTCFACPIACKKEVKVEKPWDVDPVYGGPEYETLIALGSNCGIDDLKAICKANELCQKYSLDTISIGVTIGFAMECFEKGLLTERDTGGGPLRFGDSNAMLHMVELIARREGIGDILAEGVRRAAEKISNGAEKLAVHVKGQEVPMHEPRLKKALGLGYAVSPTGPDHINNMHDTGLTSRDLEDLKSFGVLEKVPIEDLGAKKIRMYIYLTNWTSLNNCLVMCVFPPWNNHQKEEIIKATTGWNTTTFELMKVSERAINLARIYNIREGFTEKDDWLPERFFHPKTSGTLSETSVDRKELEAARRTYYGMMGWDEEKGIPTQSKLEELDIAWAADAI